MAPVIDSFLLEPWRHTNALFYASWSLQIMAPPANYKPVIDPAKKLMATPTPMMTPFYAIPEENNQLKKDMPAAPEGLPEMKPEDMQYFAKLLQVRWVKEHSHSRSKHSVGWAGLGKEEARGCLFLFTS